MYRRDLWREKGRERSDGFRVYLAYMSLKTFLSRT